MSIAMAYLAQAINSGEKLSPKSFAIPSTTGTIGDAIAISPIPNVAVRPLTVFGYSMI